MAMTPPERFVIGERGWVDRVRKVTDGFCEDYWSDFRALSEAEIAGIEKGVNRRLPGDFREFLRAFGYGQFTEFGGGIYSPAEMVEACHGPLMMQLGSSEWASDDEQRRFYVSRGRENPCPERFTRGAMNSLGFSLLDLLQIGTDGGGGYLQVFVGERAGPFGYCVLNGEEVEDRVGTFSEGLYGIVSRHWRWHYGIEEE